MPSSGYIQVHAYTSFAQLPLEDVSIAITATDGTAIALRLTDRSGKITPVEIPTPPISDSQSPGNAEQPFTLIHLIARLQGYEQIENRRVQIFPGTITQQDLELIPLAELPESWDEFQEFDTPPQNL